MLKARSIISNLNVELLKELDIVLAQKLSKDAENKAIFLIIDSYQTAYVSMATHLNTIREKTGSKVEISISMPNMPGISDVKPKLVN